MSEAAELVVCSPWVDAGHSCRAQADRNGSGALPLLRLGFWQRPSCN